MAGPWEDYQTQAAQSTGPWDDYKSPTLDRGAFNQGARDLVGGLIRGAGSIGATFIRGLPNAIGGDTAEENAQRRSSMDAALSSLLGSNPENLVYKGGKIGGEVAGTAGVGGALAAPIKAFAPSIAAALQTGGMSAGELAGLQGLATRIGAGALTGGISAGMVDPNEARTGAAIGAGLPIAGKLIQGVGKGASSFFGASSGVGNDAIESAFKTGSQGSSKARDAFTQNMRGNVPIDDVLNAARENVADLGRARQAAYQQGIAKISNDSQVLKFDGIDSALSKAMDMASFKGQIKNQPAADAVGKVASVIDEWKSLNPSEFHTPMGLDALKQRVYGVVESIPFEQKTARSAAMNVYHSIKSEIQQQAPTYAKTMQDYSEASDLIKQIEKSVTGTDRMATDTAIRKLQSLMRNNANTSYGFRRELADQLEAGGRNEIIPALAGQAVNSWMPRGIQRATASGGTGAMAMMGNVPAAVGMAAISSPRFIGEAAYKAGQAARPIGLLGEAAYPYMPVIGVGLLSGQ